MAVQSNRSKLVSERITISKSVRVKRVSKSNTIIERYLKHVLPSLFGSAPVTEPEPGSELFETSGSYTVPAGLTRVSVAVVGGGGGGWSSSSGNPATSGSSTTLTLNGATILTAGGGVVSGTSRTVGVPGGAGGAWSSSDVPPGASVSGTNGATGPARTTSYYGVGGGGAGLLTGSTGTNGVQGSWGGSGGVGASVTTYGAGGAGGATSSTPSVGGGGGGTYGGGGGGGRDGNGGGGGSIAWIQDLPVNAGDVLGIAVGAGGNGNRMPITGTRHGGPGAAGVGRIIWGTGRNFPDSLD